MATRSVKKIVTQEGPFAIGEPGSFIEVYTLDAGVVGEVAANTTEEPTFTIAGLDTEDVVLAVQKPTHQAGLGIVNARVSAADTLAITFMNNTAAGITPTDEDYKVVVLRINK